jgi:hypothetical protein
LPSISKKRVVVRVVADVVEVVVLAAGADAGLTVGGPFEAAELAAAVGGAEEEGLELVHAGVGEKQRRVFVGDDGCAGHEGVAVLLAEEVEEVLADFGGGLGHGCVLSSRHASTQRRRCELRIVRIGAERTKCRRALARECYDEVSFWSMVVCTS